MSLCCGLEKITSQVQVCCEAVGSGIARICKVRGSGGVFFAPSIAPPYQQLIPPHVYLCAPDLRLPAICTVFTVAASGCSLTTAMMIFINGKYSATRDLFSNFELMLVDRPCHKR